MIIAKGSLTGNLVIKQSIQGKINKATEYIEPITQEKTIVPTKQIQEVLPDENIDLLSKVIVNAIPNEYIIPQGEIEITENGITNVTQYASANINVSGTKVYPPNWSEIGYEDTPQNIIDGFNYAKEIQDNWDDSVTSLNLKFKNDKNLIFMPLVGTSNVTNMQSMFNGCINLIFIPQLDTSNVTDMRYMFQDCSRLTNIPLLNMSNIIYVAVMFRGCTNLTTVPLLDISNVTSTQQMFYDCKSLTSIPQLNTSNVTDMSNMFRGCTSLTTIPLLDTSNVTNMNSMFNGCTNLTTIPLLDTSKVTSVTQMFMGCSSLTTVPLLNISSATGIYGMFYNCNSLSNESLNNILQMCVNATSYKGAKTLQQLNLSRTQAETCTTLSNYQAFLDAGWTTGY